MLVYPAVTVASVLQHSSAALVGCLIVGAFAVGYLLAAAAAARRALRPFWLLTGGCAVLFALAIPFAHADAFFLAAVVLSLAVPRLPRRGRGRAGGRGRGWSPGLAAAAMPAAQVPDCRVVMLTTFGRAGYLRRAMEAGAAGFVVKDAPADVLADAIRRVRAGERVVDPALAAGESPLTARERDVLITARTGGKVAEIAARLYLSEGTVRNYVSAAITETGARNRVEAVRIADERGRL